MNPDALEEKIHLPLLLSIRDLLLARSKLPDHTTQLVKVKSHSGIIGNDKADVAAKRAAEMKGTHNYTAASICNQHLASRQAWPCLPHENNEYRFAPNLSNSITEYTTTIPHLTEGIPHPSERKKES